MSKKEADPKKTIVWLILGSYAPLLVLAVFSLANRLKNKKENKAQEEINRLNAIVLEQQQRENNFNLNQNSNLNNDQNNITPPINPNLRPAQNKGKKGRHKRTCPKFKNKS